MLLGVQVTCNYAVRQAMYLIESKLPKKTEPIPEPQPEPVTLAVTAKKTWQFWRK